jgi:tRNA threonylcarbamoyladenosine biosynthesis protein TsaB
MNDGDAMNILAIDTATACCSVMLLVNGKEFFCSENAAQSHSRHILKMIDQLIVEAGIQIDVLHLLTWNAGPGSFTGLRIGASVIQALAYSFNLPVLSLSSLEILAHATQRNVCSTLTDHPVVIAVATDARMNGIYWASFISQANSLERLEPDQLLAKNILEDKRKALSNQCFVVGDAWSLIESTEGQVTAEISAADVMALAVTKNKQSWLANPADCLPNYVHNTISWQKRQLRAIG